MRKPQRKLAPATAAVMLLTMTAVPVRAAVSSPPALLPLPASVTEEDGSFSLAGASLQADDAGARAAADRLGSLLKRSGRPLIPAAQHGSIRFLRDPSISGAEAYRLTVAPAGVTLSASTDAGLYYGAETLWQLILAGDGKALPAIRIADAPAYGWRGVMLDSARHFQPVSYIRELIDRMAMVKLNTLHWHLTDDQGWRLPVPAYPRLTSVGGWRHEAGAEGIDPDSGKPVRSGGFYTEAEIREIIAYAANRHIVIVPEVDMPGHFTASIAAYPWLASTPNPPAATANDWGILPNLINPNERGLAFCEAVLDQLMRLFPSKVIHIGGDEATKDQWNANPAIQAQMKTLGLKDAEELQGWFTGRLAGYLAAHGRRAIGWDEILAAPVPGDAMIMSWRGSDGAVTAAKAGHDTVLAPAPVFYLDNRQSASDNEPPGRGEIVSWRRLYEAETAPPALSGDERAHILGLQVNLWTEHVRTAEYADRMIWPRADVLAEIAWTSAPRDWQSFSPRLLGAMARERKLGFRSDVTPLEPTGRFTGTDGGAIKAVLEQPVGIGTLRYTLDGSAPVPASPAYSEPLDLAAGTVLTAQAFAGSEPLGSPRTWTVFTALSRTLSGGDMQLCTQNLPLRLEDDAPTGGVRRIHTVDVMHPCWNWHGAALDGVTRIAADVGHRPYNFSLGAAMVKVRIEQAGNDGEALKVRLDNCDGPVIASLPLAPASTIAGVSRIEGALSAPITGHHDLCITFAQKGVDPLWVLDRLTLKP
ncbi:family 20 glycosylhydrolase [Sphingobium sp. LMC3-1-1.1]|uniref:family 20 glycosylhydrolase n=1 Tax=Sphingobium sp. LMC3-1-1.1 TaxID=3135241 RepID=UPI0034244CF1